MRRDWRQKIVDNWEISRTRYIYTATHPHLNSTCSCRDRRRVYTFFFSFLLRKGQPLASRQGSSHDVSTMIPRGAQIRSSFLTNFLSRSGNISDFGSTRYTRGLCLIWPRPTCATWHAVQLGCTFLFVLLNLRMTTSFKVCRRNFLLGRRREMLFNVIIDFTVTNVTSREVKKKYAV